MTDPLDLLRDVTRRQTDPIEPRSELVEELRHVARGARGLGDDDRRRHLRTRRIGIAVGLAVLGAGGATVAYFAGQQPDRPEAGAACRSAPTPDSKIFAIGPGEDPLERCAELWETGVLPDPRNPREGPQDVPPLVACIGEGGIVEVYPGPDDLCAALGLAPAAATLSEENQRVAELSVRIADDVNAADCAAVAVVEARVEAILDELELADWSIEREQGVESASCVKAQVVSDTHRVVIAGY